MLNTPIRVASKQNHAYVCWSCLLQPKAARGLTHRQLTTCPTSSPPSPADDALLDGGNHIPRSNIDKAKTIPPKKGKNGSSNPDSEDAVRRSGDPPTSKSTGASADLENTISRVLQNLHPDVIKDIVSSLSSLQKGGASLPKIVKEFTKASQSPTQIKSAESSKATQSSLNGTKSIEEPQAGLMKERNRRGRHEKKSKSLETSEFSLLLENIDQEGKGLHGRPQIGKASSPEVCGSTTAETEILAAEKIPGISLDKTNDGPSTPEKAGSSTPSKPVSMTKGKKIPKGRARKIVRPVRKVASLDLLKLPGMRKWKRAAMKRTLASPANATPKSDPVSELLKKSRLSTSSGSRSASNTAVDAEMDRNDISSQGTETIDCRDITITALDTGEMPPVPGISYGLERVLFNPGVYHLQDPRTHVFNFDPYLQKIMPVSEFDFDSLKEYITSSRDETLRDLALQNGRKYVGSSSSMTSVLAHFHFLLSQWRPLNVNMLSRGFPAKMSSFTKIQRTPSAIFLRWKDGVYAIDADKEFDSANVLMSLGKSMEKLLTLSTEEFERYRRSSELKISEEERATPEAYHYSTSGDFLMRSQLDAYDSRLPGTGMFDLKTRAVVSIRMDAKNYEQGMGYQIKDRFGEWESYEREYFDMMRSAFLKYSLQVRMGRMDGIFVAFHNIERIFGFQYISLPEMDQSLHGEANTIIGDQEFKFSVNILNKILDRATQAFPETSIRLHFETRDTQTPLMYIFAEPVTEEQIESIQTGRREEIEEFERAILGLRSQGEASSNQEQTASNLGGDETKDSMETEDHSPSIGEATNQGEETKKLYSGSLHSQGPPAESDLPATDISGYASLNETHGTDEALRSSSDAAEEDSKTPGDDTFLNTLGHSDNNSDSQESSRVLGFTLTIQNRVDGVLVKRPENLGPKQRWSVSYQISEINEKRSHQVYEMCKRRRQLSLEDEDEDPAANFYLRRLRELSLQGQLWRKEQDMANDGKGQVVLFRP